MRTIVLAITSAAPDSASSFPRIVPKPIIIARKPSVFPTPSSKAAAIPSCSGDCRTGGIDMCRLGDQRHPRAEPDDQGGDHQRHKRVAAEARDQDDQTKDRRGGEGEESMRRKRGEGRWEHVVLGGARRVGLRRTFRA